jgi:heme ABC exporter ATP-binding subunit CcmA
MPEIIGVRNLKKKFGRNAVLRGINLTVSPGEKVALVGANGAGKTTLLRVICGQLRPTSGEVRVLDMEPWKNAAIRKRIGFLSHNTYFYRELTAEENLSFFSGFVGSKDSIDEVLELVGLKRFKSMRVSAFSRGMEQRLAIARMLIHSPEILLLDEPTSGLDREGRELLREILEKMSGKVTMIIASHNPDDIELCERGYIISDGKIKLDAPAKEILETYYGR